jgi:uncharacterized iron-regulated protein
MAIKDRKIPSPSEIKKSPHAFSDDELKQLISLRDNFNKITFQLGQISISEMKLKKDKVELDKQLSLLENKEKKLAETLRTKYGNGTIDLESGTFTPSE